ncbi:MAG: hypothetical protein JEZ02_17480 [Desulfatibacillum sp.]|nr:hypothetical protein [Desulfatibacillum sp.]
MIVFAMELLLFEIVVALLYVFILRRWYNGWGATKEERAMKMPEDAMIKNPFIDMTHAISIQAPPEKVFQWFKQLGQGRGGYYSYDWLERLFLFGIHNVYRIEPEFQDMRLHDHIKLHKNGMGVTVLALEENKKLVLGFDSRDYIEGRKYFSPLPKSMFAAGYWSFTLIEQPNGATRLIERWQIEWTANNPIVNLLLVVFFELPSFIMEQKMMRTIKHLAEGKPPEKIGFL